MMLHEINTSVARIIINENDIILVTTFGNKRSSAPYIKMYKIKRLSSFRVTRRIWELNLYFPSLQLAQSKEESIVT
jgi:hypothetical protein